MPDSVNVNPRDSIRTPSAIGETPPNAQALLGLTIPTNWPDARPEIHCAAGESRLDENGQDQLARTQRADQRVESIRGNGSAYFVPPPAAGSGAGASAAASSSDTRFSRPSRITLAAPSSRCDVRARSAASMICASPKPDDCVGDGRNRRLGRLAQEWLRLRS